MKKTTAGFKVGIVTSLLHLGFAVYLCNIFSQSNSSTAGLVFIPLLILDAPIIFLLQFAGGLPPLVQFGVLGSLFWFLVPWLTGRLIERKRPDWPGAAKCFSILGVMVLFPVVSFVGIIPLQSTLSDRARRPVELKKNLGDATSDNLTQRVVFSDKTLHQGITSIDHGLWRSNSGPETLVCFNWGMVLLDDQYEELRRVEFTNHYVSVRPVGIADAGDCRVLARRHFKSATLLDSNGDEIWNHAERAEGESAIDGALSGDIDGDGVAEFAVNRRYREGIKLLDKNGKTLWKHPVSSLGHIEMADVRGNGKEEFFFKDGSSFTTLDANGTVVDRLKISKAPEEFALVQWPGIRNRLNILLPGENNIRIADMRGRILMELDAPGCRTYGEVDAVAVRFRKDEPAHLAVRKNLSPDLAVLYVYDANGTLVFQKSETTRKGITHPTLTAISAGDSSEERLLVGHWNRLKGAQLVEYSLNPDAEVKPLEQTTEAGIAPMVYAEENTSRLELLPRDAVIEGRIKLEDKPTGPCLGYWDSPDDFIWFDVSGLGEGTYKVIVNYAAPSQNGGVLSIQLNERMFEQHFKPTGGWNTRADQGIGVIEHKGGALAITLSIKEPNLENYAVMNFFSMTLVRQ